MYQLNIVAILTSAFYSSNVRCIIALVFISFKARIVTVGENNNVGRMIYTRTIWKLSSFRSGIFHSKARLRLRRMARVDKHEPATQNDFPSPYILNAVLSVPGRHSALSVRHIEAADRKRGSRICFKFPFLPRPSRDRPSCRPLKLTI